MGERVPEPLPLQPRVSLPIPCLPGLFPTYPHHTGLTPGPQRPLPPVGSSEMEPLPFPSSGSVHQKVPPGLQVPLASLPKTLLICWMRQFCDPGAAWGQLLDWQHHSFVHFFNWEGWDLKPPKSANWALVPGLQGAEGRPGWTQCTGRWETEMLPGRGSCTLPASKEGKDMMLSLSPQGRGKGCVAEPTTMMGELQAPFPDDVTRT